MNSIFDLIASTFINNNLYKYVDYAPLIIRNELKKIDKRPIIKFGYKLDNNIHIAYPHIWIEFNNIKFDIISFIKGDYLFNSCLSKLYKGFDIKDRGCARSWNEYNLPDELNNLQLIYDDNIQTLKQLDHSIQSAKEINEKLDIIKVCMIFHLNLIHLQNINFYIKNMLE
jgi:hypothetical protein